MIYHGHDPFADEFLLSKRAEGESSHGETTLTENGLNDDRHGGLDEDRVATKAAGRRSYR